MDWSKASDQMVARVVQEGETYLSGQLKLATSADQRASVLAGVFTTAGTALLAGLIAFAATNQSAPITERYPLFLGGGAAVILFFAAASLCIAAIFPAAFWLPGNEPKSWFGDVESGKGLTAALAEEAEHIQDKIAENRGVIVKNAWRFKTGTIVGIAAPGIGLILWGLTSSAYWVAG